jgi:hypothetical protein
MLGLRPIRPDATLVIITIKGCPPRGCTQGEYSHSVNILLAPSFILPSSPSTPSVPPSTHQRIKPTRFHDDHLLTRLRPCLPLILEKRTQVHPSKMCFSESSARSGSPPLNSRRRTPSRYVDPICKPRGKAKRALPANRKPAGDSKLTFGPESLPNRPNLQPGQVLIVAARLLQHAPPPAPAYFSTP